LIPIEAEINIGPLAIKIAESLEILGRRFVLSDNDRSLLVIIYLLAAFWFGAAYVARAGRATVPLGLVVVALLTAALAVEPYLYAALLVEMAALVCIPIFVQPEPDQYGIQYVTLMGSLRFLTFQTLGMLFLLLTGWVLTGVETTPGPELVVRAASLMGFGFVLLLAVFPFHTWILMLAEGAKPYAAAFVFLVFSWMVSLYGLRLLDRYLWLRENDMVLFFLRIAGVMMILVGGWSAVFERHLGRMLGYAVMLDTGFNLLTVTLPSGLPLLFAALPARALALGIWALALSELESKIQPLEFPQVRGLGRKLPFASAGVVLAQCSLAGLPLLAFFPVRLLFWQQMIQQTPWIVWLSILGATGLFAAAGRTLIVLTTQVDDIPPSIQENPQNLVLLGIALAGMVLMGLFPHWFLPAMMQGLQAFEHLAP
jgi:NADH:ubiquinone oxidoreductase subunit 2 (subunit N)